MKGCWQGFWTWPLNSRNSAHPRRFLKTISFNNPHNWMENTTPWIIATHLVNQFKWLPDGSNYKRNDVAQNCFVFSCRKFCADDKTHATYSHILKQTENLKLFKHVDGGERKRLQVTILMTFRITHVAYDVILRSSAQYGRWLTAREFAGTSAADIASQPSVHCDPFLESAINFLSRYIRMR